MNDFSTSYRRELNKVKSSIRSGTGTDDVLKPSLWNLNELDFLRGQEGQMLGTFTMNDNKVDDQLDRKMKRVFFN